VCAGVWARTAGGRRNGSAFMRENRLEVAICDRAGELDCTARSPASTTQQSTSKYGGGGWNGRGTALRLRLSKRILVKFFGRGGRIEAVICNRAGKVDHTARSPTSTTQQSTSERGGGGWNSRGMAWRHCFSKGILVGVWSGRYFRHVLFCVL